MLVYIDESGQGHYKGANPRVAVVAVCVPEGLHRYLTGRLHRWKHDLTDDPDPELYEPKGKHLLKPKVIAESPALWELVERIFDLILESDIAIFAVIMNRPKKDRKLQKRVLPHECRRLVERVHLYMESRKEKPEDLAVLVFDGEGLSGLPGGLSPAVSRFLFRHSEGRSYSRIVETPLFVDSRITPGIQFADLTASVIRQCHERGLVRSSPSTDDPFSLALVRFYEIVQSKTKDFKINQDIHYGFYEMPDKFLYQKEKVEETDQET